MTQLLLILWLPVAVAFMAIGFVFALSGVEGSGPVDMPLTAAGAADERA